MAGTCWIVGAGAFAARGLAPEPGDLLIAADGGYRPLAALGLKPDLLVGDLDSLGAEAAASELPDGLPVLRFPVDKDDTDMGLAAREGWARGYRAFALYGGAGGRVDHLLANIQLMCRMSRMGASVRLAAPEYDLYAVTDGALTLPPRPAGTLASVFCNGDRATGVTLRGLRYPLDNATLACDYALGVSNHYLGGTPASVAVASGTLYVFVYLEPEKGLSSPL